VYIQFGANMKTESVLTIVSSGGHLTQALCMMSKIDNFHLVTSVDLKLNVGAQGYTVIPDTQFNALIHAGNLVRAIKLIHKLKPKSLFSTGGPICIPFALAAKIFNKRFIYLDTLSRVQDLSNTARFLYKYKLATEIFVQWQNVANKYPGLQCVGKTFDICGENRQ